MRLFGDPRLESRFWAKVRIHPETGCGEWTATKDPRGYGYFSVGDRMELAHVHAFRSLVGPIPDGQELDHFRFDGPGSRCIGPSCIDPDHTRPASHRENVLRGSGPTAINAAKTHCKCGREYDAVKDDGGRECSECRRARSLKATRKYQDRLKAEGGAVLADFNQRKAEAHARCLANMTPERIERRKRLKIESQRRRRARAQGETA